MKSQFSEIRINIYGKKKRIKINKQTIQLIEDLLDFIVQSQIDSLKTPYQVFFRGMKCQREEKIPEEAFGNFGPQSMVDPICVFQCDLFPYRAENQNYLRQRIEFENIYSLDGYLKSLLEKSTSKLDDQILNDLSFMQKALQDQPLTFIQNMIQKALNDANYEIFPAQVTLDPEQHLIPEIYTINKTQYDLKLMITPHLYDFETDESKRKSNFEQAIIRNLSYLIYVSKFHNYEKRSHFFGAVVTETYWIFTLYIKLEDSNKMITEKNFRISEILYLNISEDLPQKDLEKIIQIINAIGKLVPNQIQISEHDDFTINKQYPLNFMDQKNKIEKEKPTFFLENSILKLEEKINQTMLDEIYLSEELETLLEKLWNTKHIKFEDKVKDLLYSFRENLPATIHNIVLLAQEGIPKLKIKTQKSVFEDSPHFLIQETEKQQAVKLIVTIQDVDETITEAFERNFALNMLLSKEQTQQSYFGAVT